MQLGLCIGATLIRLQSCVDAEVDKGQYADVRHVLPMFPAHHQHIWAETLLDQALHASELFTCVQRTPDESFSSSTLGMS